MKDRRRKALNIAALLALSALIVAALMGPAGAHKGGGHVWKKHVRPKLQNPGAINTATNPVDWTKLKSVPAGFADGVDDVGTLDPTVTQSRVNGSCGAGSSIRVINEDGTVECETDDAGGGGVAEVGGVKVASGTGATTTSSTTFVDVPGATLNITVPAGQTMLIVAEFTAESSCSGGGAGEWCSLKTVIGGTDGTPDVDGDFAYDSTDDGNNTGGSWESHSFTRYRTLGEGNYTVTVQRSVTNAAVSFRLDDWTLVVQRSLVAP